MNRTEIINVIKEIFLGDDFVILKDVVKEIDEGTSLISDLALDSLQILNFIVLLERRFNFSCEEDELNLDLFDNVSTLIDFIVEKSEKKHN